MSTAARPQPLRGLTPEQVEADQRARIHTALGPAMAEHGYQQMTVEHLVRGAGISRRTFYELFEDKSDAFCAAHGEALERLAECAGAAAGAQRAWPEQIRAAVEAALIWASQNPDRAGLLCAEPLTAGPQMAYCHDALTERFSPCLDRGRGLGGFQTPPGQAEMLLAGIASLLATRLGAGASEALPDLAPQVTQLLLAPYVGTEEARRVAGRAGRP
jgi:AcrR family transcriptional regulator